MTPVGVVSIRSFVAWSTRDTEVPGVSTAPSFAGEPARDWRSWQAGALTVWFVPRSSAANASPSADTNTLLLGDSGEWDDRVGPTNLAGGVPIRCDRPAGSIVVHTSIVGLPPIFLYRDQRLVALASDIYLLTKLPGVRLRLDAAGVAELGSIGHPVDHRTMFQNVELVPAGGQVRLGAQGEVRFQPTWALPERSLLTWPQFIEAQITAFIDGIRRTDLTSSFLSLTAGLDTRTVFATLVDQGRPVTAATMTGARRSLDARIAGRLCRAYGVRHDLVTFDDGFVRHLPRYVETASRLSGGLASLGQAPEVFYYERIGPGFAARLSGNLGNQVGRAATEGVSLRGAELAVLAPRLRGADPSGHWLLERLDQDERSTLQFILQNETVFTSAGNFSIGNHFAAQQSPYANRALIETLAHRPVTGASAPSGSMVRMRLRDLRHRFLGESAARSFQRTLVKRLGGFAARCPINWGWRPAGGVSPGGLLMGGATLVGMYARARGLDDGVLRGPLAWSGLPALHDFRESRRWLRQDLREFTLDTLGSRMVRDADLFDRRSLDPILDQHFRGRQDHYETVTFALDLALAQQLFCR
jgi:hypothetical protein